MLIIDKCIINFTLKNKEKEKNVIPRRKRNTIYFVHRGNDI